MILGAVCRDIGRDKAFCLSGKRKRRPGWKAGTQISEPNRIASCSLPEAETTWRQMTLVDRTHLAFNGAIRNSFVFVLYDGLIG